MQKEKVRIDARAAGVAAYDLVQKLFLLLIERGALSVVDAQVILCDSIETQQEIMDVEWAPVNEAAAVLLRRFSEAVEQQHGGRAKDSEGSWGGTSAICRKRGELIFFSRIRRDAEAVFASLRRPETGTLGFALAIKL
jgi:hypothetical protein